MLPRVAQEAPAVCAQRVDAGERRKLTVTAVAASARVTHAATIIAVSDKARDGRQLHTEASLFPAPSFFSCNL